MAYLIDTDVLIWHLRGHRPTVRLLRELAQEGREGEEGEGVLPLGCSVISVFEVRAGMRPEEETTTEQLLSSLERYPVDEAVARRAADYYRAFARRGVTLHIADLLIAATAALRRLTLVTYNPDHFPMEDLKIYEPMPEI
jgi:predicted nucleic acid-binding protein